LPRDDSLSLLIDAVHLEHVLGEIQTDYANLLMDDPPHVDSAYHSISMPMCVMHIGHMRMSVLHSPVRMLVCMRLPGWIAQRMCVLVMLIMAVRMDMFHCCMLVFVVVILGEMQPNAKGHQRPRQNEL